MLDEMALWLRSGQLKYHETIIERLDKLPVAFSGLFEGRNKGKMLVKL